MVSSTSPLDGESVVCETGANEVEQVGGRGAGPGVGLRLRAVFVKDTEKQNGCGDDPASRAAALLFRSRHAVADPRAR